MAETTYTYSIVNDITDGEVIPHQLASEISSSTITITLNRLDTEDDVLSVIFVDPISTAEETELDNLVLNHTMPAPMPQGVEKVEKLQAAVGTNVLPTYAFSDSVSTGIYSTGIEDICFTTAGAEKFEINSTGTLVALSVNYETLITTDNVLTNKKYVDDAITNAPNGATSKVMSSWTLLSGTLYYNDFTHNLGSDQIVMFLRETSTNRGVLPQYFEIVNSNTVRIVVEGNTENLTCSVVTGRGPAGPTGATGAAGGGLASVAGDATPQLGGDLDTNTNSISFTPPTTDLTASGIIVSVTVDTNTVGVGATMKLSSDGNFDNANAGAVSTMPCTVLAVESGTGTKKVLLQGFIRNNAWNWTPGTELYVNNVSGNITSTPPSGSGTQVQKIGVAWSADVIYFNPGDYTILEKVV